MIQTITDLDINALKKNQQEVLIELLKFPKGITTKDVSNYGWVRFSGVIDVLRKKGYIIKTKSLGEDNFLYILSGKTVPKERKPAFDKLYHTLCKNGHKDVADSLGEILQEAKVIARHKQRKFEEINEQHQQ